jgi:hydrogenase nickel incorporation protein HypB
MCVTCGCAGPKPSRTQSYGRRASSLAATATNTLRLERALLSKNQRLADANRTWLMARQCVAFNLMGSPGAGKTALLEAIVRRAPDLSLSVVEGDQATERDAERIRRAGCRAVQINTGTGCHLDAASVARGLEALEPAPRSRIVLENVGNLVCPALFDLGEAARIVVLSVTEGDDKPIKYPHMFRACDALVLNKIDLLPHVNFDVERALEYAMQLNPRLVSFPISATRGDGLDALCAWLRAVEATEARPAGDPEAESRAHP